MLQQKYINQILDKINLMNLAKARFFIFGSSLRREKFADIDIGAMGTINRRDIQRLKESLEESALPYFVDVVDFNNASEEFKNNVFNNKILWIKT